MDAADPAADVHADGRTAPDGVGDGAADETGTADAAVSDASHAARPKKASETPRSVRIATPIVIGALLIIGTALATVALTKADPISVVKPMKGALIDTFSNTEGENGVGVTDNGRPWRAVSGDWRVSQGELGVSAASKAGASIVVADVGAPNFSVRVEASKVATGAGLVFRYAGPNNFWSLTAAPKSATWTLTKYSQGQASVPIKLGTAHVRDGTTVTVSANGGQITVYIDDVELKTINDEASKEATQVGLIASGPDRGSARFDDFVALPFRRLRDVMGKGSTSTNPAGKTASTAKGATTTSKSAPTTAPGA